MYEKILFCADLYASSDYAFASALDLAERSKAELIVLHVLESRHRYSGQFITEDGDVWGSEEVFDKLKGVLKEYYFSRIEEENPENVGQLCCWLNEHYWGGGRIREAIKLIAQEYFRVKKDEKSFNAQVEMWNVRSYYALKKAGFELVGTRYFKVFHKPRYLLEYPNPKYKK